MAFVLGGGAAQLKPSDLAEKDILWLLRVDLGGRTFNFCTETVSITDADSVTHLCQGTLDDLDYETSFDLFGTDVGTPSVSVTVTFPVSVATLARNGQHLSSGTAELSLWARGSTLEERVILVEGRIKKGTYDGDNEPITFTIESDDFVDTALFPDVNAVVNEKTWPYADDKALNQVYPFVFGKPGATEDATGVSRKMSGTPVYLVGNTSSATEAWGLLAGHRVKATEVIVRDATDLTEQTVDVVHMADGLGRICAVANLTGGLHGYAIAGHEYYAKWTEDLGGIPSQRPSRSGKAMNDAGELFQFLIRQSTIKYDEGRVAALVDQIIGYKVGGFIGERVSPWEWLVDNLLPLVPVSIGITGAAGLYPILWNMAARVEDAVETLTEGSASGGNCFRTSPVSYEEIDLANEIRLNYAFGPIKDLYRASTTLNGSPETVPASLLTAGLTISEVSSDGTFSSINPDITGWPTAYARFSHLRHGKHAVELESNIVYERQTADAILSWMARARATYPRTVSYECSTKLAWLQPGDVVALTDDSVFFSNQVAIVRSVTWGETALSLSLLLIEDHLRDTNLTT